MLLFAETLAKLGDNLASALVSHAVRADLSVLRYADGAFAAPVALHDVTFPLDQPDAFHIEQWLEGGQMRLHRSKPGFRQGYVLIAVLIVIVVLTLAAYQFTELMTAEYRASVRTADAAQARHAAVSGVHYAAALLADPGSYYGRL